MRIQRTYRFWFAALLGSLFILLGSCQKVVRLDLNDAERKMVVEAMLTEGPEQSINLKRTSNFYQQGQDPVQTALVTIEGPGGQIDTLDYDLGGNYRLNNYQPQSRSTYQLRIEDGEEVYRSGMIFPDLALIDTVEFAIDTGGSNLGLARLWLNDQPGIPNHYRIKYSHNGVENPRQYNLFSDQDTDKMDGDRLSSFVFLGGGYQPGDTVIMELQSLDEGSYQYFVELNKALGNNSTVAAPFNPMGNILGDVEALGYFGGMLVDTVWFLVP